MSRLLPLLLLAPVLALGAWLLGRLGRSDEERIRETIAEMVEEWNDMSVRGVTARLAEGFEARRDGHRIAGEDDVADALRYFFAQEGNVLAGTMPWRAELDEDALVIDLEAAGGPHYDVEVRFLHAARTSGEPVWVAQVSGEVAEVDGAWLVSTAEVRTLSGTQLGGSW